MRKQTTDQAVLARIRAGVLLILAVPCAKDEQPLSGTSWTLVGMNINGQLESAGTEIPVTIKLLDDGMGLSGHTQMQCLPGHIRSRRRVFPCG